MATISQQTFDEAGTDLTLTAAAGGGDQFANQGQQILIISNGDASSKTVTVTAQNTSFESSTYGNSVKQDQALAVAAGSVGIMGPFPVASFNDSSGNAQITYSAVTSLEIAVVKQD